MAGPHHPPCEEFLPFTWSTSTFLVQSPHPLCCYTPCQSIPAAPEGCCEVFQSLLQAEQPSSLSPSAQERCFSPLSILLAPSGLAPAGPCLPSGSPGLNAVLQVVTADSYRCSYVCCCTQQYQGLGSLCLYQRGKRLPFICNLWLVNGWSVPYCHPSPWKPAPSNSHCYCFTFFFPLFIPFSHSACLCPALFHSCERCTPPLIQPLSPLSSSCHSIDASDQQLVAGDDASRSGMKPGVRSGRLPRSDLPVTVSGSAQAAPVTVWGSITSAAML